MTRQSRAVKDLNIWEQRHKHKIGS